MKLSCLPQRFLRIALLSAAAVVCSVSAHAQSATVNALTSFVKNECGGDWKKITDSTVNRYFDTNILNGHAGTFSATPLVSSSVVATKYQGYYTKWFRTKHKAGNVVYPVDVFTRIQVGDRDNKYQNFLRVYSNADSYLSWHQYLNLNSGDSFSNPIWTGQTYDSQSSSADLHAHWKCGMQYPSNNSIKFNAMHEIYIASNLGGKGARIQVEVRQSSNQGTTAATSKGIYTDPTYNKRYYLNSFSPNPNYNVWTFTLEKNYNPSSTYDGYVNLSQIVKYMRSHPDIMAGRHFPTDGYITRVESGVETWFGSDGTHFTSYLLNMWRQ